MSKFSSRIQQSEFRLLFWLVFIAAANGASQGYDVSLIAGLQILPEYKIYFNLSPAIGSLNVAIASLGSIVAVPIASWIPNRWGRRPGLAVTAIVGIIGAVVQGAAVNEAMFCIGRLLIGISAAMGSVAVPIYIAEASAPKYRDHVTSLYATLWGVGAILGAIVTFGAQYLSSSWSWRTASLLQIIPSLICLIPLSFVPESPRWLMYMDRHEAARKMLIKYHANGDSTSVLVATEFEEIRQTLEFEKRVQKTDYKALVATRPNRWRISVCVAVAVFSSTSGFLLVTFFLGVVLTQAGITSIYSQLAINIGLNVWILVCSIIGSIYIDLLSRRLALISTTIIMAFTLVLMSILTKVYIVSGIAPLASVSNGIIFLIFFFAGLFSFVWIPLPNLYMIEVLSYSIRSNGLALSTGFLFGAAIFNSYVVPYGIEWSAWGFYLINGVWCLLACVVMWFYFPETRGMNLEEIDVVFDGKKHFDTPAVIEVREGERL